MRWSIIDNQPFFSHAYFCSARRISPCRARALNNELDTALYSSIPDTVEGAHKRNSPSASSSCTIHQPSTPPEESSRTEGPAAMKPNPTQGVAPILFAGGQKIDSTDTYCNRPTWQFVVNALHLANEERHAFTTETPSNRTGYYSRRL